jgi:long-chain acyl-CoA synthetase
MNFTRIFDILEYQKTRFPREEALCGQTNGAWQKWSTDRLLTSTNILAHRLLELGIRKGDRIGIAAHKGSPEWLICDLAFQKAGAISVPIHASSRKEEVEHIIQNAGIRHFVVSNEEMAQFLDAPNPELLISFEPAKGAQLLSDLLAETTRAEGPDFPEITPEDIVTILYTSGTTGLPKGVVLTHKNLVSNLKAVLAIVPLDHSKTSVSFLPLSHVFERMVLYVYLTAGVSTWFVDRLEELPTILKEVRPHFFTAVPRVIERSYERLYEQGATYGLIRKKLLNWALHLGENYPYAGGGMIPLRYWIKLSFARLLVYRQWKKALGGRLEGIVVGAAALQPRLGRLFSAAAIAVREGYGLTETSPVVSFNRFEPGGVHFGTVGMPVPGVEVQIDTPNENGEGEVLVKGPNVMQGYWKNEDATKARFTADGWLRTGDLGRIEHARFLRITGRQSELFKTSTGKFVAPGFVENHLKHSRFIEQCLVVGLNRPYPVAIIRPNFTELERWCTESTIHWTAPEYMVMNPKVEDLFDAEVNRINESELGTIERVGKFILTADEWTMENGLLTPTFKVRRKLLEAQYEAEINKLYDTN